MIDCQPWRSHGEVLLGGALHAPVDALRLGLLDALDDNPLTASRAVLASRATHPAEAYAAAKAQLRGGLGDPDPAVERAFIDDVLPVWASPALQQKIAAFLSRKR